MLITFSFLVSTSLVTEDSPILWPMQQITPAQQVTDTNKQILPNQAIAFSS